jgi:hypothetical protein
MASKRPSELEKEVDKVLERRKRFRNKVACYACNKRKVKCDARYAAVGLSISQITSLLIHVDNHAELVSSETIRRYVFTLLNIP